MTEQFQVGVVGAGTMGIGVAHTFAASGVPVVLVDTAESALDRARAAIAANVRLYPLLAPGQAAPSAEDVLSRITTSTAIDEIAHTDFVVENITEKWELKTEVYGELTKTCPPSTVFCVNTSAIPITRIAALVGGPHRVIGTHFMNPVPLMPLVEVIRGVHTDDATVAAVRSMLAKAGKDSVVVNDGSGFVTNRVAMLTINEAIFVLQEGVSTPLDIDRLFRQCFGQRMGPLETADLIGLDTILYSLEVLLDHFADPKYRPAPLLRQLVAAGHLGRKSGKGFHSYVLPQNGAATR
jgi:3-hydroxybutyryl-CoA dehydrogenase